MPSPLPARRVPARRPEVWYVMPSANAANAARSVPVWRDHGYKVAVLQDRARFDLDCDAVIVRDRYPGWAASVNALFREAVPASCPVIVAGGDDMFPDPGRAAHEVAEEFMDHFAGTFGVMQATGDDFEATRVICGSPWLGRAWMERMYAGRGGLCEAYFQQWADDELYWVSRCAGRLWVRPDLAQRHEHFLRSGSPAPLYWVESAAGHDERDCLTFIARSRAGFPGAAPADEPRLLDLGVFERAYTGRAEAAYRTKHGGGALRNDACERLECALRSCAAAGHARVALYGAGQHTRRCGEALRSPPVRVVAIIDDDAERIGTALWNFPVVSRGEALGMGLDAVVLSSDAMESVLLARCDGLVAAGVKVLSLYAERRVSIGVA